MDVEPGDVVHDVLRHDEHVHVRACLDGRVKGGHGGLGHHHRARRPPAVGEQACDDEPTLGDEQAAARDQFRVRHVSIVSQQIGVSVV
ncbi:hypothetical protein D3C83_16040 [compost metagenome]